MNYQLSFEKLKTDSYCVGGRHRSATKNLYADKKSKGSKVVIGYRSLCNRKKIMTVSDITIEAEGLLDFFRILGIKGTERSKKVGKKSFEKTRTGFDYYSKHCYSSCFWKS